MPGALFIEGEQVNLRTVEEEDIEFLRDNINNPAVGSLVGADFKPVNMKQQREFFENQVSSGDSVHLAICRNEEIRGIVSIIPQNDTTAKIGLWIAEDFHGEGYGSEASELMIDYAFDELRYHRILARALDFNEPSNRIWEKLGFTEEGVFREHIYKRGEYRDLALYGITEDEWRER